jgi:hypothetical protein
VYFTVINYNKHPQLCNAGDNNLFFVAEKQKLEQMLKAAQTASTEAATASKMNLLVKIGEEKENLEKERANVEAVSQVPHWLIVLMSFFYLQNKKTIDDLNKKIKDLVVKHSEILKELEEETKRLASVEEVIKAMQQQLAPLHLKA